MLTATKIFKAKNANLLHVPIAMCQLAILVKLLASVCGLYSY